MNNLENGQELGYSFIPFDHFHSIGFKELIINITRQPTGTHFDPILVHLPGAVRDRTGSEPLTIFHPHTAADEIPLAPGRISIEDRKGKKVEAFSFGGTVFIDHQPDCTTCRLVSDAPILFPNRSSVTVLHIRDEIRILLAERRAAWIKNRDSFERKLVSSDPLILYAVFLTALETHFRTLSLQKVGPNRKILDLIRHEISSLKHAGKWPSAVPSLSEAL